MKQEQLNYPEKPLSLEELTAITVKKVNPPPSTVKTYKSVFKEIMVRVDTIKTPDGKIMYKHERWKLLREKVKIFQHTADTCNQSMIGSDISEINKYYPLFVLPEDDNQERVSELFDHSRIVDKNA